MTEATREYPSFPWMGLRPRPTALPHLESVVVPPPIDREVTRALFVKKEKEAWTPLGKHVVIADMPDSVTDEILKGKNGMQLIVKPGIDLGTAGDLQRLGVDRFLRRAEALYPGLHYLEKDEASVNKKDTN